MELWDLYSIDRIKTGQTMVRGEAQPAGTYRLVVHVCVFNRKGQMLIQHRQPFKKGWSNLWDLSVGGCAVMGDDSRTAAERELFEEIGLCHSFANTPPALTLPFAEGFDDYYLIDSDTAISRLVLQSSEVQAVRWASAEEIKAMIAAEAFIPYHPALIELLFSLHRHQGAHTREEQR